jgi:hypothetical protein
MLGLIWLKFNDHYVELHFGSKRVYGHVPFLAILCLFPYRSCLYGTKLGTQTLAILKHAFGHYNYFCLNRFLAIYPIFCLDILCPSVLSRIATN